MSSLKDISFRKKRKHLNLQERLIIERMLRENANKAEIASALYRDKSTIKREIKRGSVLQRKQNPYVSRNPNAPEFIELDVYFADVGQRVYEQSRQKGGARNKVVRCGKMVKFVEEKVLGSQKWSPDTAIGYARKMGLFLEVFCTKTFYNWIDDGLVGIKNIDLLLKVRRKPKRPRIERKKRLGKSIEERPAIVGSREEFGHWEGDGIVGKDQRGHLLTLVERKLGIGFLFNVESRESKNIVEVLDDLEVRYGSNFRRIFKTITFDNGSEFSDSAGIENGGRTSAYYAHPYSSFERGTNENWNGIVRRFIPKGSSFNSLTSDDMQRIANYINTMPRKRFGYKTPLDLWKTEMEEIQRASFESVSRQHETVMIYSTSAAEQRNTAINTTPL